jgi:hypothetical protein
MAMLVESSWLTLFFMTMLLYGVGGSILGALLMVTSPCEDPDDLVACPDSFVEWWYRACWILGQAPTSQPTGPGPKILSVVGLSASMIANFCLFGVIYEKLTKRRAAIAFANSLVARLLPEEEGGHLVLTFRFAHLNNEYLANPELRMMVLKRKVLSNGDGVVVQVAGHFADEYRSCGSAPASFCHHIVDEKSPLYDPNEPTKCNFSGILMIFAGVSGIGSETMQFHGSLEKWTPGQVLVDHDFVPMYSTDPNAMFDYNNFNATKVCENTPPEYSLAKRLPKGLTLPPVFQE